MPGQHAQQLLRPFGRRGLLYAIKEYVGTEVGATHPEPWPDNLVGSGAHWLDHTLLMCELNPETGVIRVAENSTFRVEVLDFFLTEQVIVGADALLAAGLNKQPGLVMFGGGLPMTGPGEPNPSNPPTRGHRP